MTDTRAQRQRLPRLKAAFLADFCLHGNLTRAAAAAGVDRGTVYKWQGRDSRFAAAFAEAETEATERHEVEAHRRAVEGVLRKKFTAKGEPVIDPETKQQYVEREFSDNLLMFILKARAPDKYRERHEVHQRGEVAATVAHQHQHQFDWESLNVEQLRLLRDLIQGASGGDGE